MTSTTDPLAYARLGLDDDQLGHIRRFRQLARQLPNDWSGMQGRGTGQDDFGGYRFQLAYMTYALALTHLHRLPNAPGAVRPTLERLMAKMLLPEVWSYWHDVSTGGSIYNAQLGPLPGQWDPVLEDNIMYSAYVQSMALLHAYLFRDDRYAEPGALTFEHWSYFWGGEPRRFEYDQNTLNDHVYWQLVRNGYLGVACEPNCVFQICNQPAILGFRLHDLITGGDRATHVIREYENAWAGTGRLGENGHYIMLVASDSRAVFENANAMAWPDAWNGTLMNMWNRDFVHEHYPRQIRDFLVRTDAATIAVKPTPERQIMGQSLTYDWGDFGWVVAWASEMGDTATVDGMLAHAERFMNPVRRDGALFYPRNDTAFDPDGNLTLMDPISGNVLIGYARLNVPDGLWKLFNRPWGDEHFSEPLLTEVADDVDVRLAWFDRDTATLHFALQRAHGTDDGRVTVSGIGSSWTLIQDGSVIASSDGATDDTVTTDATGSLTLALHPSTSARCRLVLEAQR